MRLKGVTGAAYILAVEKECLTGIAKTRVDKESDKVQEAGASDVLNTR